MRTSEIARLRSAGPFLGHRALGVALERLRLLELRFSLRVERHGQTELELRLERFVWIELHGSLVAEDRGGKVPCGQAGAGLGRNTSESSGFIDRTQKIPATIARPISTEGSDVAIMR